MTRTTTRRLLAPLAIALLSLACDPMSGSPDGANEADAGTTDGSTLPPDSSALDGGASDASTPPTDGGSTDREPPSAPVLATPRDVTATGLLLEWTAATDDTGVAEYRVSMDDSPLATVTDGLTHRVGGLEGATSYAYFVVAVDAAGNVGPASNTVTATTLPLGEDDGRRPVLSQFRVEASAPNRLYFDSSEAIVGSDATGFVVSGNTIASVTVLPGRATGHFFTVAEAFTHWDNTLVRYEGDGSVRDEAGNSLHPFMQEYVENRLPEPLPTGLAYYVSTSGDDSGDGLSEGGAWRTLSHALAESSPVSAGDIVYVEAGNYGAEQVTTRKNAGAGPDDAPIFVVGYQSTPGDTPDLGWSHPTQTALDASVMPLFEGDGTGTGFEVRGDNLIFRNLQITRFGTGFYATSAPHRVNLDNLVVTHAARGQYAILYNSDGSHSCRITNSVAYNAGTVLMRFYGTQMQISDSSCIQDEGSVDYYIAIRGNDNIVRNVYMERVHDVGHTGHGISVKSVGVPTEHGLYENIEIVGIKLSIEARHDEVRFNHYRHIDVWRRPTTSRGNSGGIAILNGASFNVFDDIKVTGTKQGVLFAAGGEDPEALTNGHENIIRNCTFTDNQYAVRIDEDTRDTHRETFENHFVNCSFYGDATLHFNRSPDVHDNHFVGCSIVGVERDRTSDTNPVGFDYTNSNFFESWATPEGAGNISVDPQFTDPAAGDLRLSASSPAAVRMGAATSAMAPYDADGVERIGGMCAIGPHEVR